MKKFLALATIVMLCLFIGCSEDDGETDNGETDDVTQGEYQGFPDMKGGEWAEYNTPELERIRYEYLGTDTIDDTECFVIEFEMEVRGENVISQIWIDKQNNTTVLYVTKQAGLVVKMDTSQISEESMDIAEGASEETPDEYEVGAETYIETYETPTGKEVEAAVFKENSDEVWVSEEVPFGFVQQISEGNTVFALYDFSFSGAKRDISKEEVESASGFPNFPNLPMMQ